MILLMGNFDNTETDVESFFAFSEPHFLIVFIIRTTYKMNLNKYIPTYVGKLLHQGDERSVLAKKNIIRLFFNKGLSLIISVLFVPIFLFALDKTYFGIWATLLSVVNWIGFFDIGIGQGLRNKLAESLAIKDYKLSKSYVSTAYISLFVIFVAIIFLFLLLSLFVDWSRLLNVPTNISNEINLLIIIVVCIMTISFIFRIFNSILLAAQLPAISSNIDLLSQLSCFIIILVLSKVFFIKSIILFGIVMTLIPILITLVFTFIYFRGIFNSFSPSFKSFDKNKVKQLLILGGSFFIIQLSLIISAQTNNIIISNIFGPEAVSDYYVSYRYMSVLQMGFTILSIPFWSATTDAFVHGDIIWIKKMKQNLFKFLFVFIIIGIVMIIMSKYIFHLWVGDKIVIDYYLLILLFIYIILQLTWVIYGNIINGIGKIKIQIISTVLGAIIHIPFAIFLSKYFGVNGIVLSLIFTTSFFLFWAPAQTNRLLNKTATGIWNK